jgi:hypothetical protein
VADVYLKIMFAIGPSSSLNAIGHLKEHLGEKLIVGLTKTQSRLTSPHA